MSTDKTGACHAPVNSNQRMTAFLSVDENGDKNTAFGRTQYVLLIGTVKSAFALLLTKVTK